MIVLALDPRARIVLVPAGVSKIMRFEKLQQELRKRTCTRDSTSRTLCLTTYISEPAGWSLGLGLPCVPLFAVQLLYINLATDVLPALAIGIGPPDPFDLLSTR
jgi:hypothetical protein